MNHDRTIMLIVIWFNVLLGTWILDDTTTAQIMVLFSPLLVIALAYTAVEIRKGIKENKVLTEKLKNLK